MRNAERETLMTANEVLNARFSSGISGRDLAGKSRWKYALQDILLPSIIQKHALIIYLAEFSQSHSAFKRPRSAFRVQHSAFPQTFFGST